MSGTSIASTGRRVACAHCGSAMFDHCVSTGGEPMVSCHTERMAASRFAPELNPGRLEMLRRLHADPTRRIPSAMRRAFLRLGWIEPSPEPGPTGQSWAASKAPKRHHPLTEAGQAVIAFAAQEEVRT